MKQNLSKITLAVLSATSLTFAASVYAADAQVKAEEEVEVIQVMGMRGSLTSALAEKRDTANMVEIINAIDIGKLPDQNLAEVLENVTGVQITRTAGIGTGVQIRGSNANRVEINGASTVGSGTGRSGMNFEDLSAAIIAGVEITKAPDAKTTEGSIGGTVNLRTIRPLELSKTLGSIRVQGEDSSLTTDGVQPRLSGAYGDNWELDSGGKFGFVASGSYSKQEATSFRPRVDRDGSLVANKDAVVKKFNKDGSVKEIPGSDRPAAQEYDFLGIQFLNQELENFEYETTNLATSFEYAPNDNLKFFFDAIVTNQERRQESTRVQASGVSSVLNQTLPTEFETINFGALDGVSLGSIQAAVKGTIQPINSVDDDDPNLRFNSDTGARITDTQVFRLGGDWQGDNLTVSVELSSASSDTETPKINTQLNFINPNPLTPLDGSSNDNSVPFIYDLTSESLAFGIDFDSPFAPTVEQLTDLSGVNVVLDQVDITRSTTENSDDAFRTDFTYFIDDNIVTSVDFGYRYNMTKHSSVDISDRIGGFSKMKDSASGTLFSDLLVAGPSHFGDADGRELALRNFIIVDPDLAFNNPDYVISTLEKAQLAHRAEQEANGVTFDYPVDVSNLTPADTAAFDVEEETHALYLQANFEYEMIRGNIGVRHISTDIESSSNSVINGVVTPLTNTGDYSYTLPRLNLVADVTDDIVLRLGWGQDIRRPNFGDLNTSTTFGTNENQAIEIGNAALEPEEVTSFDISAEWYFAEAAVVSIGYFKKDRTNLFVTKLDSALSLASGFNEAGPTCSSGVYNPAVQPNAIGDPNTTGLCVDAETILNDQATTTQSGIEMAFQYDLSSFEEDLGWASGFGIVANYTIQENKGGSAFYTSATRGTDILNALNGVYDQTGDSYVKYTSARGLLDFSENAYNVAVYYEKFGLSARVRYTWREAFRTEDTAAGASLNSTLGFPVVAHDRGQLNASVSYDVNENLNLGVEAVNLTKSDIKQSCVNEGAMLCAEGITDRRITFGASYRF
ncbi:MAG: iron complex outermembrane receptor protein [Colwellia sp.]|jgi:iron complex outermembrane receptor protein